MNHINNRPVSRIDDDLEDATHMSGREIFAHDSSALIDEEGLVWSLGGDESCAIGLEEDGLGDGDSFITREDCTDDRLFISSFFVRVDHSVDHVFDRLLIFESYVRRVFSDITYQWWGYMTTPSQ